MNELTTAGRVAEALGRCYGGRGVVISTLASDLFPVVQVGEDRAPEELLWLMGARRASQVRGPITPAAGQFAEIGLFGAGGVQGSTIIIVEQLILTRGSAGSVRMSLESPAATAISSTIQGTIWDGRSQGQLASGIMGSNSTATAPGTLLATFFAATTPTQIVLGRGVVITPGTNLRLRCEAADVTLSATIIWRERPIESWERG